jgi:hypothetical protein
VLPRTSRAHAEDRNGHHHVGHAAAKDRHHAQGEQDAGKGEQHVGDAHHDAVPPAAVVAGQEAQRGADDGAEHHRKDARGQRNARAHQDAAEDVAAQGIDAEPVRCRRAGIDPVVVEEVLGVVGHDPRRHDGNGHQQQHEDAGAHGDVLHAELAPELGPGRAHAR